MKQVVVAKILQEALHGILAPPTGERQKIKFYWILLKISREPFKNWNHYLEVSSNDEKH